MRITQRELREGNPTLDEMRYDIAELYAMNMTVNETIEMLIYGNTPLDEAPDIEIIDEWEQTFGELKNWEIK